MRKSAPIMRWVRTRRHHCRIVDVGRVGEVLEASGTRQRWRRCVERTRDALGDLKHGECSSIT